MITIVSGALNTDLPMALYRNLLEEGGVTSAGNAVGSPLNVLGPQTYDFWQGDVAPNRVKAFMDVLTTADCWCIEAHDIGSKGATVQMQYSINGTTWITAATLTPTDDSPIMVIAPPVAALGWGINILSAPGGMPNIGIMYIGPRMVFPSPVGVPYAPLNLSQKIEVSVGNSLAGQILGATFKRKGKSGAVPLLPLDGAWAAANLPAFREVYDTGAPFFFAACPMQYSDDLVFCTRSTGAAELRPTYIEGGLWASVKLEVDAYGA